MSQWERERTRAARQRRIDAWTLHHGGDLGWSELAKKLGCGIGRARQLVAEGATLAQRLNLADVARSTRRAP